MGLGQLLGTGFVAQGADRGGWRADPDQASGQHGIGKLGVLAQETVAGVHGVGAAGLGGGDQFVDAQVAVGSAEAAQALRQRGFAHMQRFGVGIRIHRHGCYAHGVRAADDAACDLAAVGDQQTADLHERSGFLAMPISLDRMPIMTSSAPPPMEASRPSRNMRETLFSSV